MLTGLLSAGTLQLCTGQDVAYNVFSLPNCVATQQSQNHVLNEQPPPIGFCQNLGMGRAAYNSIEILGCSSTCLCFKQYASQNANDMCNPASRGQNVKMSCTNKCLQDCNGVDCGDTALPDSGNTRLMLTGSGQLCASPVADEDFVCETTGMIKDSNGNFVDDFASGTPTPPRPIPTPPSPTPPQPTPTIPTANPEKCGCASCTTSVWNTMVRGYSCGARIEWLKKRGFSESNACKKIGGFEFPRECGKCNPNRCNL